MDILLLIVRREIFPIPGVGKKYFEAEQSELDKYSSI